MKPALASLLVISLAACAAPAQKIEPAAAPTARGPDIVDVEGGSIRGLAHGEARAFKGIPFAAPPVGDLRWRPPAPVTPWRGVRDATGFGYACMQTPSSHD